MSQRPPPRSHRSSSQEAEQICDPDAEAELSPPLLIVGMTSKIMAAAREDLPESTRPWPQDDSGPGTFLPAYSPVPTKPRGKMPKRPKTCPSVGRAERP